ncbi:MAG: phosphopentomutase/phosphoglucosamine mutase [Methanolinea sp.]|nr:phosphopentomutase/phosphoglucosamine mutase [Methanolinea sp.]
MYPRSDRSAMEFGSSGIRAVFGRDLVACALALGGVLGGEAGTVLVGHDTRTTSPALAHALAAGVLSRGARVASAGIVPTPAVGYSVQGGTVGCMVTASHNPPEYNGLKVFLPGGAALPRSRQDEIGERLAEASLQGPGSISSRFGRVARADILPGYVGKIVDEVECGRSVRVVLDCGGGAGSVASPAILKGIGAEVRAINCTPTGRFPRPSEPSGEALPYIGALVRRWGADGAIAHDGDADRMVAWDRRGRIIPGDSLLVLFARYLGARRVVTTVDASMVVEECAEVVRTPVGDSYVSEALLAGGEFGGEPSGAWIFPRHSLCPDGPYAAALFCQMVSEWDVAAEVDALPRYPILRESVPCTRAGDVVRALGAAVPTDGIRVERDEGWYLVRASGTEPKVRVTAEGKTREAARSLLEEGLERVVRKKREISGE